MDLLRSCSKQKLRFIAGDLSQEEIGTWYFAKKTALPFPIPHSFGSPVWDTYHPMPTDIGFNAEAARSWYRGTPLNSSDGTKWAGDLAWFVNGADQAENLPRGSNGTPVECLAPPFGLASGGSCSDTGLSSGGIMSGGECKPGYLPGVPCTYCSTGTPSMVEVSLSGFSGAYAAYTGTHLVPQTATPCEWFLALAGTLSIFVQRTAGGVWSVTMTGSPLACIYVGSSSDCLALATLTLIGSTIGGDPTCTIKEA